MKNKNLIFLYVIFTFAALFFFENFAAEASGLSSKNIVSNEISPYSQVVAKKIKGNDKKMKNMETAILGAGCFWCVEAIFQKLNGIVSVQPGYAGGTVANPTYEVVCTGTTGHAEVAEIVFDSTKISYGELLDVFFEIHDPTTLNRQGNDIGEQYRSVIFYTNVEQKKIAEETIKRLEKEQIYNFPIVTEVEKLETFYPAENYHKNYYENNKDKPYCQFVISPKVKKFEKKFSGKIIK